MRLGRAWPAEALRRPLDALRRRRRARIALLVTVALVVVLGGGWLLLRNSPLVAVEHVDVVGVHGPEAAAIESALIGAAHKMTTLHVRTGALRAAVAAYPVVSEVRASASFPHGLRITVVEQLPVAALVAAGTRTAVAANGLVLGPALLSPSLPSVGASFAPATGQRVAGASQLAALEVLGAAPAALASRVSSVYEGPRGLTVSMRNGLLVYFGDATRPHAKWFALARVLADPSSAGASYVDVELPSRAAAGFPEGHAPNLPTGTSEEAPAHTPASRESTVGALAERLAPPGSKGNGPAAEPEKTSTTGAGNGGSEAAAQPTEHGEEASHGSEEASQAGAAEAPTQGTQGG